MRCNEIPALNDHFSNFLERIGNRKPAFFIDYDGVLSPIVPQPEDAILPDDTRQALLDLSRLCFVAIVSGRDLQDVKSLVNIDRLVYSGSHGFDTIGPGFTRQHEGGTALLPEFEQAEKELRGKLSAIPGAKVERKLFAIAIHFRNVAEASIDEVKRIAGEVLQKRKGLKKAGGKKIIEFRPDVEWNKGKAVEWLLEHLKIDRSKTAPIYIGDDLTDEDAFKMMKSLGGAGILVGDHGEDTFADYRLEDTGETAEFLNTMIAHLQK